MEGTAFETNPQWSGCYCQFYLNKPEEQPSDAERAVVNRKTACDRIKSRFMNGYLAYKGDEVIGWVAANKANNFVGLPPTGEDVARVPDLARERNLSIHLYGKAEVKPGRKMGHVNRVQAKG